MVTHQIPHTSAPPAIDGTCNNLPPFQSAGLPTGIFLLSLDGPGLALDCRILPSRIDNYLPAANFRANCDLLNIEVES